MYRHQASLPRLPVADLETTLQRYLSYVEPLVEPQQLQATQQAVESFLRGPGPSLQAELLRLDEEAASSSWIAGFWKTM